MQLEDLGQQYRIDYELRNGPHLISEFSVFGSSLASVIASGMAICAPHIMAGQRILLDSVWRWDSTADDYALVDVIVAAALDDEPDVPTSGQGAN